LQTHSLLERLLGMKFRNGRSDIIFILDVTESQEAMKLLSNNSLLGQGYWRGFMRRNGHIVKSKKSVKFD